MSTGCIIGLIVGLVGLVLVAMLVAIAIPVGRKVLDKARSLQVKATAKGLEIAVKGYVNEYSRLPNLGTSNEGAFMESEGLVLDTLTGKNTDQNPRQIGFFELPPPKGPGGSFTTSSGVELRDLFGNRFRMHFDWNGDGSIPDPEHSGASLPGPVIIYSAGADGDYTTWKDNVKSWGP